MNVELRALDEAECRAGGLEPEVALALSVARSTAAFTYRVGADVVCYWGYRVRSVVGGEVDMWVLSTPRADGHPTAFGRKSRRIVRELLREFTTIRCEVWEGHEVAREWLAWLGFRPMGRTGAFIQMEKRRKWDS